MSDEKKCGCNCGCEGTEEVKQDGCGCGHDHHEESGCGCDCGCEDHEALTVALEDEEGNSIICEIVDGFVFENNEYALVQNPEDNSVYLFKVVGDDEIGELVVPEDDEYNAAKTYYENEVASHN